MELSTMSEERRRELIQDGFVSVKEAADYLRVSRANFYKMMNRGEIVFAKFGALRRIPWRALYEYAAKQLRGGYKPS